jgi:hypothetical protein
VRNGLDVMLAFFDAARRARGPVPSPSRAKRTPRAPSSSRTVTARAPRERPARWVVDVPEDGEFARVLVERRTEHGFNALEYVDREWWVDEQWPIELGNLELVLVHLSWDESIARVLRIEALR